MLKFRKSKGKLDIIYVIYLLLRIIFIHAQQSIKKV
jgi:hypothetical protein